MNILILGAGRVGEETARLLVGNNCNVTVVDSKKDRLLALQASYDLRTICGDAANPELLQKAGATTADIIIAVTAIDEVNLVACKVCSLLAKHTTRIARIRNNALNDRNLIGPEGFAIDHSFCPEQMVAENLCNAIAHPGCLSVHRFADGRVVLAGVRISSKSEVSGDAIGDLRKKAGEIDYRIVSVYRDGGAIKPMADTRLFVGDEVYLLTTDDNLDKFLPLLLGKLPANKRIFLAGGGNIGLRVAQFFEKNRSVKVLELNHNRCRELSEKLDNSLILKGRATDEKLLLDEGITETDIFCALTNDDEENILSAILAKRLGAKQVTVITNHASYVDILERQVDVVLSPALITIGSLLAHVRMGDVNVVHSLRRGAAEAIEVVLHGSNKTSPIVGREIQDINWPEGTMPGAIVRHSGEISIAHDNTVINDDDRLICFVSGFENIKKLEKLVQVNINFF